MLESGSDVDLEAMKAQLLGDTQQFQTQLPNSEPSNALLKDAAVDAELEDLKRQLEQL